MGKPTIASASLGGTTEHIHTITATIHAALQVFTPNMIVQYIFLKYLTFIKTRLKHINSLIWTLKSQSFFFEMSGWCMWPNMIGVQRFCITNDMKVMQMIMSLPLIKWYIVFWKLLNRKVMSDFLFIILISVKICFV